ncbi:hypothetical protein Syun_019025 [Stephania yunnanensis]|uniref:Uncharacterized protein n=1 Tax=Stephania yunnanensis TaxID=152371 RepID=A0AAP0ITC0_9MAGN
MESLNSCKEPQHLADGHSEDSISCMSHKRNSDAQLRVNNDSTRPRNPSRRRASLKSRFAIHCCCVSSGFDWSSSRALAGAARVAKLEACWSYCPRAGYLTGLPLYRAPAFFASFALSASSTPPALSALIGCRVRQPP